MSTAPYGVIFDGRRIYVGSPHGRPIRLADDIKSRVQKAARSDGVWFEGDGGDVAPNSGLFGSKNNYRGSWDAALQKSVKGYPIEFLTVLFSNVAENKQKKIFLDPTITIFDSILRHRSTFNYFTDGRTFTSAILKSFLKEGSENGYDFVALANKRATKENLDKFFDAGEKLMWPSNWEEYPNKFGKLAKKAENTRNKFLLDQKSGVFVVGAGHLLELKRLDKTLKIQGGERASE